MTDPQELEQTLVMRKLRAWNSQAVTEAREFRDGLTIVVSREHLRRTAEFLCGDPELRFTFLSDLIGVDRFPIEPRFELNYQLLSLARRDRLRLKVHVAGSDPVVESATSVWPAADWPEREVFDLLGVRFEGHPNLQRILMPEGWEGHPLRKDYPVEGYR